ALFTISSIVSIPSSSSLGKFGPLTLYLSGQHPPECHLNKALRSHSRTIAFRYRGVNLLRNIQTTSNFYLPTYCLFLINGGFLKKSVVPIDLFRIAKPA